MDCTCFTNIPSDQLFQQFFEITNIHLGGIFIFNSVVDYGLWSAAAK